MTATRLFSGEVWGPTIVTRRLEATRRAHGWPTPVVEELNGYLDSYGAPPLTEDPWGGGYLHVAGRRVSIHGVGTVSCAVVVLASLFSEDPELLASATVVLVSGRVEVVR